VSGDVAVHEENGGSVIFTPVAGQIGYQAPTRILATLQLTGGIFYFARADKSQLSFNSAGQLVMESDRNGYQTTFTYNSSSQLTTVTDPGQRTLTFAYFPDGQHIRTVTDSAARSPIRTSPRSRSSAPSTPRTSRPRSTGAGRAVVPRGSAWPCWLAAECSFAAWRRPRRRSSRPSRPLGAWAAGLSGDFPHCA